MKKEENYKKLYAYLLEQGEIRGVKRFTGDWEQDREKFIKQQTELEELANVIDIDETE